MNIFKRNKSPVPIAKPIIETEQKMDFRYLNSLTEIQKRLVMESGLRSTDVYDKVLIVNLCIRIIQMAVISLINTISLYDKNEEKVKDNLIEYLLFKKPNELDMPSELLAWYASDLKLTGDAYLKVISATNIENPKLKPGAIVPLFARNVKPIAGNLKANEPYIKEYKYRQGMTDDIYKPEQIIHIKTYNPSSRIKGMSDLEAMSSEIQRVESIDRHQRNTLRKGLFPNLNIHTDQNPNKEQRQDMVASMKESFEGPDGDKLLFTWGGFKAKPLSLSPADLELLENEKFTGAMIANALGVPGLILSAAGGSKDYVTAYREAHKQLMLMTAIPLMNRFLEKVNSYFFPEDDLRFKISLRMIPELQVSVEELTRMWWVTPNQKRTLQGMEQIVDPNMDKIYVPGNYVSMDSLAFEENNNV